METLNTLQSLIRLRGFIRYIFFVYLRPMQMKVQKIRVKPEEVKTGTQNSAFQGIGIVKGLWIIYLISRF